MIKLHYGGEDHYFHETDILTPGEHYQKMCNISSDINEHLPTLKKYTEDCISVTEMGVRCACSTWSFIEGKPKKITCIDIKYDFFEPSEKFVNQMCENYGIQFNWITGDTLKLEIEKTDLLFIDTLHTYNQLYSELILHHKNVNKYIILHDTTTFADIDELLYEHASDEIKNKDIIKSGLNLAISDFLIENKEWSIKEVFTNNNGLTVLSKSN
jgi:hypothetical protein